MTEKKPEEKRSNTGGDTCKCGCEGDGKFDGKEKFQIALETRNLEIDRFWRRSNYFLFLNTSVGVAAGSAHINGIQVPFSLFCFIGICVCYAWRDVVWGAKFWQSYWEQVVTDLQDSVGFKKSSKCKDNNCTTERCNAGDNPCEAYDFFSPIKDAPHIMERVKKSLGMESSDFGGTTLKEVIFHGIYLFFTIPVSFFCSLFFIYFVLFSARMPIFSLILAFIFSVVFFLFSRIMVPYFNTKIYRKNVLSKPSVSRSMLKMVDFFLFVWMIAFVYSALCIFGGDGFKCSFPTLCPTDNETQQIQGQCPVDPHENQ